MRVFGLFSIELVNFEAISFTAGLLVLERPPVFGVLTLELVEFVDVVDADLLGLGDAVYHAAIQFASDGGRRLFLRLGCDHQPVVVQI